MRGDRLDLLHSQLDVFTPEAPTRGDQPCQPTVLSGEACRFLRDQ